MTPLLWLVPLGFLLGAFGTLIGAGGGFLLVPLLLLLYPHESTEVLTSISLAVVFFNAASGSLAYARMGRIDYRAAFLFSLATVPGAILGALSTAAVPRRLFDAILGILMIWAAAHLLRHPHESYESSCDVPGANGSTPTIPPKTLTRDVSSRTPLGMLLSVGVGYVSSFLGIGGGIVHVPLLVRVLRFPVHTATATSHLILAIMALSGTVVHVTTGAFHHGVRRTAALAVGVVFGAQLGAILSNRIHGNWIIRSLAIALAFVGLRILLLAWKGA